MVKEWRTKVGKGGKAARSRKTGKPIRYPTGDPSSLPRDLEVVEEEPWEERRERIVRRVQLQMKVLPMGSVDLEMYKKNLQEKYGEVRGATIFSEALKTMPDDSVYSKRFTESERIRQKMTVPIPVGSRVHYKWKDDDITGKLLYYEKTKSGTLATIKDDDDDEWEIDESEFHLMKKVSKSMKKVVPKRVKGRNPYPYSRPRKIIPMLAKKAKESQLDGTRWAQRKYDGTRAFTVIDDSDDVVMRGRSWKKEYQARYPDVVRDLAEQGLGDAVLDGELVYFDKKGKDTFLTALATAETAKREKLKPKYVVFDILYHNKKDLTKLPLRERHAYLHSILDETPNIGIAEYVKTAKGQKAFWKSVLKKGLEGVMLKDPDAPYEFKRSKSWLKLKPMYTEGAAMYDCAVIGFSKGRGKFSKLLGSLHLVQKNKRGQWVFVGSASGMNDDERTRLTRTLRGKCVPESKMPKIYDKDGDELEFGESDTLVRPKMVVEVSAESRFKKTGRFRMPVFKRVRDDKNLKDVDVVE